MTIKKYCPVCKQEKELYNVLTIGMPEGEFDICRKCFASQERDKIAEAFADLLAFDEMHKKFCNSTKIIMPGLNTKPDKEDSK